MRRILFMLAILVLLPMGCKENPVKFKQNPEVKEVPDSLKVRDIRPEGER